MNSLPIEILNKILAILELSSLLETSHVSHLWRNLSFEHVYFCYECACFKHKDHMQKYACRVCGGRKCLDLHTTDENLTCKHCDMDHLCNDCKAFAQCCHLRRNNFFSRVSKSASDPMDTPHLGVADFEH
jgi:hypothetical protein